MRLISSAAQLLLARSCCMERRKRAAHQRNSVAQGVPSAAPLTGLPSAEQASMFGTARLGLVCSGQRVPAEHQCGQYDKQPVVAVARATLGRAMPARDAWPPMIFSI